MLGAKRRRRRYAGQGGCTADGRMPLRWRWGTAHAGRRRFSTWCPAPSFALCTAGAARRSPTATRGARFHLHSTTTTLASLVTAGPAGISTPWALWPRQLRVRRGHLEGAVAEPSAVPGAPHYTWMRARIPPRSSRLLAAADGTVRMVTLARVAKAIRRSGASVTPKWLSPWGIRMRPGPDTPSTWARQSAPAFNAMPPLDHQLLRPVLALLCTTAVTVEIIADGVHVHPRWCTR